MATSVQGKRLKTKVVGLESVQGEVYEWDNYLSQSKTLPWTTIQGQPAILVIACKYQEKIIVGHLSSHLAFHYLRTFATVTKVLTLSCCLGSLCVCVCVCVCVVLHGYIMLWLHLSFTVTFTNIGYNIWLLRSRCHIEAEMYSFLGAVFFLAIL
jgi:hypothetical protein